MATYNSDPIIIKKYIKFPDRRLISGFLTVNCISHSDNDEEGYDDAMDYFFTNYSGLDINLKSSTPFKNTASSPNFADPGRTGLKQTFGDYDCLLFWVAGGMTLNAPIFETSLNQAALVAAGFVTAGGSPTWEDDRGDPNDNYADSENWYDTAVDPCQHFLKSHLVSRINNGYGHTDTDIMKINPILTNTFEIDDLVDASMASDDATAVPTNAFDARKGKWARHIISNGVFSADTDGDFTEDLSIPAKNTYFPMVENVEIYGKHNYTIPYHINDAEDDTCYSNGNTTVGNYSHEDDFWSMVIKISMRGYNHNFASDGLLQATKEFFQSRTNVSFQPFGETGSFDVSDSLHT